MKRSICEAAVAISLLMRCETSFAQDMGLSLRLHYRSLLSALFGVFGGDVYHLKAYLMLEHWGGWNVGIMGANIHRDKKGFTADDIEDGKGSEDNYFQRQYGLRACLKSQIASFSCQTMQHKTDHSYINKGFT